MNTKNLMTLLAPLVFLEDANTVLVSNLGDPGHRWLTAIGSIENNRAVMSVSVTSGGLFDTPTEINRLDDGAITLTFDRCSSGTVDYDTASINQAGSIPIQRVANDNVALCEALE